MSSAMPATTKTRVAAVEGWFTTDGEPRLIATKCAACGTYFFPKRAANCNNPGCGATELTEVLLGRRGRVWSYTENHYAPPPPFVAKQPFEPYAIAAVELPDEKIVVMGQVVANWRAKDLQIGMELEIVLETLYEDDEHEYLVWKWSP